MGVRYKKNCRRPVLSIFRVLILIRFFSHFQSGKEGQGRFLIRLFEILLLLTFPTRKAIDIHKTIALNSCEPQFCIRIGEHLCSTSQKAWSPVVAEALMTE